MTQAIDSYGVRATDDVRGGDDMSAGDAELDELREREQSLRAAYLRNPWDAGVQRSLVRVEQRIRRLEESAQRLADNAPTKPPALDAAEYARHGSPIRWVQSPPSTDALDVATPVRSFTDAEQLKKQIAFSEAAIGYGHPELAFRLGQLRRRLSDVQTHRPPANVIVVASRRPVVGLGHGDCATPRPIAMPGNVARIADAGIDLETSLQGAAHLTTPELERYVDAYIAYTATKPELRGLHDRALHRGPTIVADRLDADEAERQRSILHAHVEDQKRTMRVQPPIPIQQRAAVGEVAIPIAKAVDAVAQLTSVVGELLFALETVTGHETAGLGPKMDEGERALNAALLLAPFAASLLKDGVRGAAGIVRIARATGKSTEEVRSLLVTAQALEKDRAVLQKAFATAKAGGTLTTEQQVTVVRAQRLVGEIGGISPHGSTVPTKFANPAEPWAPAVVGSPKASALDAERVVGDAEASFAVDSKGVTLQARGEIEGPHVGRKKGYVPKPTGGLLPGDHRGHLIPEGGVRDPRKVNVSANIVSEAAKSNLSAKKRFDNLASEIARANPGRKVETVHDPVRLPGGMRPLATLHRILVDGVEVHRIVIENK